MVWRTLSYDKLFSSFAFKVKLRPYILGAAAMAVTYAQTLLLTINIRTDEKSQILPPVLDLTYAQRDPSYDYGAATDSISFHVLYTMASDGFWDTWEVIFIFFMIFAGVQWAYGVLKTSRYGGAG